MKLEDQVCSLELAKQLKELGVTSDSLFYWRSFNETPLKLELVSEETCGKQVNDYSITFSAFTVSELVNLLQVTNKKHIIELEQVTPDWCANKLIEHYEGLGGE